MPRWLPAALAVVALAVVALLGVRYLIPAADRTATAQQQGEVPIGGPFALTDQTGKRVTEQDFRGRHMLVYFGYTACPDMCPLGLQTVSEALDDLPPELQDKVVPLFITVDPARDTVEVMRDYVKAFHPRLVGLTGSEAEVADALRAYRVYARKADATTAGDGGYLVDHSTFTYLMDTDGKYLSHFGHGTTPEGMAGRLGELLAAS
jgi:cytochrome oxidase Cu insertion factor (SCO1/SenC/PrrC family)